jgi:hypothetical protein
VLPGSGIPLKDYPLHVSVADVEREAGRRLLDRVERCWLDAMPSDNINTR